MVLYNTVIQIANRKRQLDSVKKYLWNSKKSGTMEYSKSEAGRKEGISAWKRWQKFVSLWIVTFQMWYSWNMKKNVLIRQVINWIC